MLNYSFIREHQTEDRPRERLIKKGAESLSNCELLAILLRTGTAKESVLQLANNILQKFDGLLYMRDASFEEITSIKGIGLAKAAQVFAAIELGKRLSLLETSPNESISSPKDLANYLMKDLINLNQEHFIAIFLNSKNRIIHKKSIFIGSLNRSIVHPREIFHEAVRRSAASFICAHNHPSGDPTPSREDIEVTARLQKCGELMGINLLDHLIIGEKDYVSLRDAGYF